MVLEGSSKEEATTREPLLLTLDQVSQSLHLSRTTLYRLIAQNGLPVIRIRRTVRISPVRLRQWLEQREQISSET